MKVDLDHLPSAKQRELRHVVRVLFEEFEREIGGATQPWKKRGRILKAILYGSYARGDWVDDLSSGYKSDYDILVVVNDRKLTDPVEYWGKADNRLTRDASMNETLSAPVNFIVHDLADLNDQLARGLPFFVDIAREGVALYEAEGFDLATPRLLPPEEAKSEARRHLDTWFQKAETGLKGARFYIGEADRNDAAFLLHQATERLYHCVLLVLTLYSPKSHKLNFLRSHAEEIAPSLIEAWPRLDRIGRRRFELLRRAYVDARYSEHYEISDEELGWLAERVALLRDIVNSVCERRLASRD